MIYLAKTENKPNDIRTFLRKKKSWERYLVLVIASTEDQMLIGKQITRSKLGEYVNWLLATPDELRELMKIYKKRQKEFGELFLMELTMTGNKGDIFLSAHNWQMLGIDHPTRTDPFDEIFAEVVNDIVDQALYNYNKESKIIRAKLDQLFCDLMATGMFQMQPDPKKVMGN